MTGGNEDSAAAREYNFPHAATVIGMIREPQTESTSVYKALFPQGAGSVLVSREDCDYISDLAAQWGEVGKSLIYNPLLVGQGEDHVFIKEIFDGDIEAIRWAAYPYLFAMFAAITNIYERANEALSEESQGKVLYGENTFSMENFLKEIFTKDDQLPNEINYVQAGLLVVTEDLDVGKLGGELRTICENAERTKERAGVTLEDLTYNVLAKRVNDTIGVLYLQMAGKPDTLEVLYNQQIELVRRQIEEMSEETTVIGYPPILHMDEPVPPEPEEPEAPPESTEPEEPAKPESLGIQSIQVEGVEAPIGGHEVQQEPSAEEPAEPVPPEPEEPAESS